MAKVQSQQEVLPQERKVITAADMKQNLSGPHSALAAWRFTHQEKEIRSSIVFFHYK